MVDKEYPAPYTRCRATSFVRGRGDRLDGETPIAALSLPFNSTTLPVQAAGDRFLAKLRTCAARIREGFPMNRVEARRADTPAAAP